MEISCLLVFHVVFGSRATAARLLRCRTAEGFPAVQSHGILVAHPIVFRVYGTHQLVVQYTFIVVHVAGIIRVEAVEVLGEFGQVVGTARLVEVRVQPPFPTMIRHGIRVHAGCLRVGLPPHLPVAHAAHGVGVASLDEVPEVQGQVVVVGFPVGAVRAQCPHYHGDVLVGVPCAQVIHVVCHGVEECRCIEAVGRLDETGFLFLVLRHLCQPCQRLRHAAHLSGDVHVPHLVAVART